MIHSTSTGRGSGWRTADDGEFLTRLRVASNKLYSLIFFTFSCHVYVVAAAPKLTIAIFISQFQVLLYVIPATSASTILAFFHLHNILKIFPFSFLPVEYFPPIFWRKYYMVFLFGRLLSHRLRNQLFF